MSTTTSSSSEVTAFVRPLLVAAILAIVLGLLVQVAVMLAARAWPANLVAETAQKITWSTIVCSALAIGTSLRRALPAAAGILGALSAPAAFFAAKASQKALTAGAAAAGPAVPSAIETAVVKGVQYLLFGLLIAFVASRRGWRSHLLVGFAIGAAGAVYVLVRLATGNPSPPPTQALFVRGVNELVFPIGCALVLWVATRLGNLARGATAK
jgi:cell shape-determining protein MreD